MVSVTGRMTLRLPALLFMGAISPLTGAALAAEVTSVPRYDHIVVIIEENHTADQIVRGAGRPTGCISGDTSGARDVREHESRNLQESVRTDTADTAID